jgi:hypothetical protein
MIGSRLLASIFFSASACSFVKVLKKSEIATSSWAELKIGAGKFVEPLGVIKDTDEVSHNFGQIDLKLRIIPTANLVHQMVRLLVVPRGLPTLNDPRLKISSSLLEKAT